MFTSEIMIFINTPVFDTTPPDDRAATDGPRGCASRVFHPSEDLSELPPLRVPETNQGYGWTGVS